MNIFSNGKEYFLKFEIEDREKAIMLYELIFSTSPDERNDFETKYGIKCQEIGFVDWKKEVKAIRDFMNSPERLIP